MTAAETVRTGRPVMVAQIVTTMARGGAQATVVASSSSMGPDVEVTVLAGPDTTDEGTYWDSDALAGVHAIVVPNLVRRISPRNDLSTLVWLIRWLRKTGQTWCTPTRAKPECSAESPPGPPVSHASTPCTVGAHCVLLPPRSGWLPERWNGRWPFFAHALVVVGTPDLEFGLDHHIGTADRSRVIRSGVDTTLAKAAARKRDTVRAELGLKSRFVVGMVARMSFQKDHATLIKRVCRRRPPGLDTGPCR